MLSLRQVQNQVTKKQRELQILLMKPANIPKKVLVNLTDNWQEKGWQINWLVNHQYKFVYCPIPKVATTSMAKTMLLLSDCKQKEKIMAAGAKTTRIYVFSHLKLSNHRCHEAQQILDDKTYLKFTIVRNPWSRLVSAYLDKFVINRTTAISTTKQIENAVYQQHSAPSDRDRSVNFKQFLEYVAAQDKKTANVHWKPQYMFLEGVEFDFIGKLESLSEDFLILKEKLEIDIDLAYSSARKAEYISKNEADLVSYAECYPDRLKQLDKLPNYKQFYTPELIELVREQYRQDIEMFDYSF